MNTRTVLGSAFASAAILLIGWQAGTAVTGPAATSEGSTSGNTAGSTASGTDTSPAETTPSTVTSPSISTYTGDSVSTRFGDVQVEVTLTDGQITDVVALHLTDSDRKSVQISNRAAPLLRTAVLAAQSAQVDSISGATYTSDAYLTSLQSALDQAGM